MSTDTISVYKKVTSKALHSNETIFVLCSKRREIKGKGLVKVSKFIKQKLTKNIHEGGKLDYEQVLSRSERGGNSTCPRKRKTGTGTGSLLGRTAAKAGRDQDWAVPGTIAEDLTRSGSEAGSYKCQGEDQEIGRRWVLSAQCSAHEPLQPRQSTCGERATVTVMFTRAHRRATRRLTTIWLYLITIILLKTEILFLYC